MLAPTLPDLNSQRPQEVRKEKTTSVGVIQDKPKLPFAHRKL